SACMMLDHIGETEKAARIRKAIESVIADGKVRSYDMLKLKGSQDVLDRGAASTTEMTDAIISALN
ncbi:isocitrate/isopropylmalate dehydrogenase family protein, partial [Candidatus Fermentibacteria bacterium]